MPCLREGDGDTPRPAPELDDRPLDAVAHADVEVEILHDALAPNVVERAEALVGIAAWRCELGSHSDYYGLLAFAHRR